MNNKELQKAQKRLRTTLYTKGKFSESEKVLAEILFKVKFGEKTFRQLHQIKIPKTWNIKLYSLYDDLKYGDFDLIETKMRSYFEILAQEKHGDTHNWLLVDISDYFKDCIINNKNASKTFFKSAKMKVKVSFKKRKVILMDFETNKNYEKEFELNELVLFDNIKDMITKGEK